MIDDEKNIFLCYFVYMEECLIFCVVVGGGGMGRVGGGLCGSCCRMYRFVCGVDEEIYFNNCFVCCRYRVFYFLIGRDFDILLENFLSFMVLVLEFM